MLIATSDVSLTNINDGKQLYNWIMYASSDTPAPSDISSNPTGKTYVGFAYNKNSIIPSTNYRDYTWMQLDGHTIQNIKYIYYATEETDPEFVPTPFTDLVQVLHFSQGNVYTLEGYLVFNNVKSNWTYNKPTFTYGKHLWISMEITTNDGNLIYTIPQISQEWEVYYMKIGGTNLIRNSKSLIDEKIYWKE